MTKPDAQTITTDVGATADALATVGTTPEASASGSQSLSESEGTDTSTEAKPTPNELVTDPFDYSRTVVTITYTYLPEDGHPEGRAVLIGLSTMGQEPLFTEALREHSPALALAVTALQEQYKLYLPDRKVQVEIATAEAKQAAVLKPAGKTTLKQAVPDKHAQPLEGVSEEVVVSERPLKLFG